MIFAALPAEFPKLKSLVQSMGALTVSNPPPIEDIGARLRGVYARASADDYRSLSLSELRKLPYAYWLPPKSPLPEIHPALVQRYWAEACSVAIDGGPRRAKRWLTPLFFAYCDAFNPVDARFAEFSDRLRSSLSLAEGTFADRLKDMQREVQFFDPERVPKRLADVLMNRAKDLDATFELYLLWPKFVDTPLGAAVFDAVIEEGARDFEDRAAILRVLDWAKRLGAPVSQTTHRVKFANALLTPWARRRPPDNVKATLIEFFVRVYGDPRLKGHLSYRWQDVSPRALQVLMTWLAGDTLRGFMRVLEQTADDIWRHRQKFWMAYYDAGYIQEAWLALGSHAEWFAKQLQAEERGLGYGRLDSGATPNQSVLLLRIGQLVFSEWSHNGSLRAYTEDAGEAPRLYQHSYHGVDLRAAVSMDFHGGENLNPELRHMNSAGGTWQRKARDFIRKHTGISLNDRDII